MSETGFLVLVAMWGGFGIVGILLFFKRGLAASMLRSFGERSSVALGYLVVVILIPGMLILGAIAFLYAVVAESKSSKDSANAERPPEAATRAGHGSGVQRA